ncbi:MAG: hypothetical protein ACREV2_18600, partial [Burkholderiales bacterium]
MSSTFCPSVVSDEELDEAESPGLPAEPLEEASAPGLVPEAPLDEESAIPGLPAAPGEADPLSVELAVLDGLLEELGGLEDEDA